jgi:hypothetical protein
LEVAALAYFNPWVSRLKEDWSSEQGLMFDVGEDAPVKESCVRSERIRRGQRFQLLPLQYQVRPLPKNPQRAWDSGWLLTSA